MTKPPDFLNAVSTTGFFGIAIAVIRKMFSVQRMTLRVVDLDTEKEIKALRAEVAELKLTVSKGEFERRSLRRELEESRAEVAELKKEMKQ